MFCRALILFGLLIAASISTLIYVYSAPKLPKSSISCEAPLKQALQREPIIQKRLDVRKDIWIPKLLSRDHVFLTAKTSELILIERNKKLEATELLQSICGMILESGSECHFTASEGAYFYPSQRFIAQKGAAEWLRSSKSGAPLYASAELATASFLERRLNAETVEILEKGAFCASGEKASYSSLSGQKGSLEVSPSCQVQFSGSSLQCTGPVSMHLEENCIETSHPFQYEDADYRIHAESGSLAYAEGAPQTIQCEGKVRFISNESYALADHLVYFPETKKLHLFAKDTSRVLFWKSDGSIQISAPEVAARLGESEEIKGIGDVHFTFDLEEKHRIETLFGKYL